MKIGRLQITPPDGEVDVFERTDGFQFYNDLVFNKKIEAVFADLMILVEERNRFLANELNPGEREFNRECLLIDGLEESRAKRSVHTYRSRDDTLGSLPTP